MDIETGNSDLGPVIANALQFILDMFKSGPHKATAQMHSDAIATAIQNVQTDPNDTLPGDLATAQATGEPEGQQYSLFFLGAGADINNEFERQVFAFEGTLMGMYELIDIRMPTLSQVMGKDNQVVGSQAGGTGDFHTSMQAIVSMLAPKIPLQFKVEGLVDPNKGKESAWLSVDQIHTSAF